MSDVSEILQFAAKEHLRREAYKEAQEAGKRKGPCRGLRVYVVVNADILPAVPAAVQAAHAVAGLVDKFRNDRKMLKWVRRDKTLCFLRADDRWFRAHTPAYWKGFGLDHFTFREPDLGRRPTATAFYPTTRKVGKKLFSGYQLL